MSRYLKILFFFILIMLACFLSDYLHPYFGDIYCTTGSGEFVNNTFTHCNFSGTEHLKGVWHWDYKHWVYLVLCILFFYILLYNFLEDIANE